MYFIFIFVLSCLFVPTKTDVYDNLKIELQEFNSIYGRMATNIGCFNLLKACNCDLSPYSCSISCQPEYNEKYCQFAFFINVLSLKTGLPLAQTENYYIDSDLGESGLNVKFNTSQKLNNWQNPATFTIESAVLMEGLQLNVVVANKNGYPDSVRQYVETFLHVINLRSQRGTVTLQGIQYQQNTMTVNIDVNGAGNTTPKPVTTTTNTESISTSTTVTTSSPSTTTSVSPNSTTLPVNTIIVYDKTYQIALWILLPIAIIELIVIIVILVLCLRQRKTWKETLKVQPRFKDTRKKRWDAEVSSPETSNGNRDIYGQPHEPEHQPAIAIVSSPDD